MLTSLPAAALDLGKSWTTGVLSGVVMFAFAFAMAVAAAVAIPSLAAGSLSFEEVKLSTP